MRRKTPPDLVAAALRQTRRAYRLAHSRGPHRPQFEQRSTPRAKPTDAVAYRRVRPHPTGPKRWRKKRCNWAAATCCTIRKTRPGNTAKDADKKGDKKKCQERRATRPPNRSAPCRTSNGMRRAGFNFEQLLQGQADGPMVLALFPERVDISKLANPGGAVDNPPSTRNACRDGRAVRDVDLKDPAPIELALEKSQQRHRTAVHMSNRRSTAAHFTRGRKTKQQPRILAARKLFRVRNGQRHTSKWRAAAVLNYQAGTERMSARKSYLDYMANFYDPNGGVEHLRPTRGSSWKCRTKWRSSSGRKTPRIPGPISRSPAAC